jgi:hypothetical protein
MKAPTVERPHPAGMGGVQKLYRFPNGYGASVVQFPRSYGYGSGRWELAVLKFTGEGDDEFKLTYDTDITDDVIGYLTEDEVDALLDQVEALK